MITIKKLIKYVLNFLDIVKIFFNYTKQQKCDEHGKYIL